MTDNVLHFPRQNATPRSMDEVVESVDAIKAIHVDHCLGAIMDCVIDQLQVAGFDLESNEDACIKDIALVFASMRSVMLKVQGVPHPFQRIADEIFVNEGDGMVSIDIAGMKANNAGKES